MGYVLNPHLQLAHCIFIYVNVHKTTDNRAANGR